MSTQVLRWEQPKAFKQDYELCAGDDVLATLHWDKPLGSLAVAECAEGAWAFQRIGFFKPRITVRLPGSQTDVATFRPGWDGRGTLEFTDGRRFRWVSTNFWGSEWAFTTADGARLLRYRGKQGFTKQGAQVEVEPGALALSELPLLVLLGWYLTVLMWEDSAATVAATVAATSAV